MKWKYILDEYEAEATAHNRVLALALRAGLRDG
jgi:hypothetical protein